ncbi:hypothetical protein [Halorussus salinus]|uniref:hypothetical protein n=1 Tax=Halorussus salinus TaxID=1364935 RepID=UPI00109296F5|nr:hypothetical protein [Halorussus salinus]
MSAKRVVASMAGLSSVARDERLERVQRLLVGVTALCTLAMSAWIAITPPATDYEVLYRAYPDAFWAVVSVGLMAAVVVFLVSAARRDGYWRVALLFVCVIYVLFNLLPVFRGWAMYGRNAADVLYHVHYTNEILRTDHIQPYNIYPVVHLLLAELRFVGLPVRAFSPLLSAFFNPVYLLGVYLLSRQFVRSNRVAVATLACAVPLLYSKFHHTLHPAIFSFMTFPAFLFLLVKYHDTRNRSYLGLVVLVASSFVFFHPVTSLYVVVALSVSLVVRRVYSRTLELSFDDKLEVGILGFVFVTWLVWYAHFELIRDYVRTSLGFTESSHSTVAQSYGVSQVNRAHSLQQLALGFVDKYGPIFLICGLAGVATVVAAVRFWRRRAEFSEVWLSSQFFVGAAMAVVTIVTYVIAYNPVRNSRYMILMATLLAGLLVYRLLTATVLDDEPTVATRDRLRQVALVGVVVLLLVAVPISVTNSYQLRQHMTFTERDGTDWFYDHYEPEGVAVSHDVSFKMGAYLGSGTTEEVFDSFGPRSPIPRYFGYGSNDSLRGVVNGTPTYLVTKEYDREYYESLKEFNQRRNVVYTNETVAELRADVAVNRIYANGGYAVWSVGRSENTTTASAAGALAPRPPRNLADA